MSIQSFQSTHWSVAVPRRVPCRSPSTLLSVPAIGIGVAAHVVPAPVLAWQAAPAVLSADNGPDDDDDLDVHKASAGALLSKGTTV